ncbi:MAG: GDYXXLXY domain-containing protein [Flavobacteriales bacterium]
MRRPLIILAVAALAQWAVPVEMLLGHREVLREGTAWKFRLAPVDPHDPFRGEYVRLDFDVEQLKLPGDSCLFERDQRAYALLQEDADGFARFSDLLASPPADGPYLKVHVDYCWMDEDSIGYRIAMPVDRYYLPEGEGPIAEQATARWLPDLDNDTLPLRQAHAVVRILDGAAALEEVYVDDLPLREWVALQAEALDD